MGVKKKRIKKKTRKKRKKSKKKLGKDKKQDLSFPISSFTSTKASRQDYDQPSI